MKYYLDTSALVKLFHEEDGTATVTELVEGANNIIYVSELARVEFASMIQRKTREGLFDQTMAAALVDIFDRELGQFSLLPLNSDVAGKACRLLMEHGNIASLRALGSLQLASFLGIIEEAIFVSSDTWLAEIAKKIGARVLVPE